ncbi:polyhydroxyalkanoate depolymerase [Paracoccus pacificus]|uniref:Polyhydroxyalkanoate depolymerase n=1 Tax=Paracoccus pacificus TaxID=1463598 RepID=A0ABW4R4D6_9RHOB
MKQLGIKGIVSYDAMETLRNTNEWLGATARAIASYPVWALSPNPMFKLMSAWGRVTERSFGRMVIKPDWNIPSINGPDGQDHIVRVKRIMSKPFGDLIHFEVARRDPQTRRVLLVAPMSGHYATLLRSTVTSLLPDCEVYVTDWHNARDIPVSEGKFDVEDYTQYLVDFIRHLGPEINVIAVCQPAPLALAATAVLAEEDPAAQPRSLTLIGGPIDPDAAPTEVTDFGNRMTMGQLEQFVIQSVGFKYAGAGRMVYPGLAQLSSFIAMNAETHAKAFIDKIMAEARGKGSERDRHNKFYDEYLAVMDMTAEFYLSTVERIFKNREIARNAFTINGKPVDIGRITNVAVMTVEGAKDDISAPGQCVAALDLLTGLDPSKKSQHLEPDAGHYGIFAGQSWRLNIRPLVMDFIDEAAGATTPRRRKKQLRVVEDEVTRAGAQGGSARADAPPNKGDIAV